MKTYRIIIALSLVLSTVLICSCSNRRKVTVIQGNEQPPTSAKPVGKKDDSLGHNYSEDIKATLTDTELVITTPNTTYNVRYDLMDEIEYMTQFDYSADTLTDGVNDEYEVYAKMKDASGSEYFLFIYKTTPVYISVSFAGQTYVFNVDGAKNTKAIYDSLKTRIN